MEKVKWNKTQRICSTEHLPLNTEIKISLSASLSLEYERVIEMPITKYRFSGFAVTPKRYMEIFTIFIHKNNRVE